MAKLETMASNGAYAATASRQPGVARSASTKSGCVARRRQPLFGGGEHGRREIDQHRLGSGVAREQHRAEDAIPAPRSRNRRTGCRPFATIWSIDRELLAGKRDRAAHRIEKPADGLFPLPCGRRRVILLESSILHTSKRRERDDRCTMRDAGPTAYARETARAGAARATGLFEQVLAVRRAAMRMPPAPVARAGYDRPARMAITATMITPSTTAAMKKVVAVAVQPRNVRFGPGPCLGGASERSRGSLPIGSIPIGSLLIDVRPAGSWLSHRSLLSFRLVIPRAPRRTTR